MWYCFMVYVGNREIKHDVIRQRELDFHFVTFLSNSKINPTKNWEKKSCVHDKHRATHFRGIFGVRGKNKRHLSNDLCGPSNESY